MRTIYLLGLLLLAAASHSLVVLDTFSDGAYAVSIQSGTDVALTVGSSMVGGDRGTFLEVQSNPNNQFLDLSVGGGFSINSSGAGLDGKTQLGYGFDLVAGNPVQDPMNLDLSGESAFQVTYTASDLSHDLTIVVFNGASFEAETVIVPGGIGTPTVINVPFLMWSGTNFSDVDSIVVELETPANGDVALSRFEAVPEPATLLALSLGAGVLLRRRRK